MILHVLPSPECLLWVYENMDAEHVEERSAITYVTDVAENSNLQKACLTTQLSRVLWQSIDSIINSHIKIKV